MTTFQKIKKISRTFPNSPGVYFWRDKKGAPLYIGRAGSLKKRIASYFLDSRLRLPRRVKAGGNDTGGGSRLNPRIREMTEMAHSLDFETTDTLLEAIVLEANLIKQYWPKYNVLEKDGKSFMYMIVTDELFPRILMVRGRELDRYTQNAIRDTQDVKRLASRVKRNPGTLGVFGPYQSYYLLRKALEIIRKIFPYSNCRPPHSVIASTRSNPGKGEIPRLRDDGEDGLPRRVRLAMTEGAGNFARPSRACFHYQIGLCPGVCVGAIDSKTYRNNIKNIILFFRGDKKRLLKKLKRENPEAVLALKQVEDTALLADSDVLLRGNQLTDRRIEGYDISHLSGQEAVGALVVFENGEADPSQYRLFNIRGKSRWDNSSELSHRDDLAMLEDPPSRKLRMGKGFVGSDDLVMLEEVMTRRLRHKEWPLPQIVFVDGGVNQVKRVNSVLKKHSIVLPVVGLSKAGQHAASSAGSDKLIVANAGKAGKELIIASRNLFQQVRNEAHRFSINARRKRAKKSFLR